MMYIDVVLRFKQMWPKLIAIVFNECEHVPSTSLWLFVTWIFILCNALIAYLQQFYWMWSLKKKNKNAYFYHVKKIKNVHQLNINKFYILQHINQEKYNFYDNTEHKSLDEPWDFMKLYNLVWVWCHHSCV